METNKKVTTNKDLQNQKNDLINQRKEQIKSNSKKNLLDLNLDEMDEKNLLDLISKNKNLEVKKNASERFIMYQFQKEKLTDKEQKKKRTQIRKKRNKFIDNIIYFFSNQKKNELKEEIKAFEKFYKETYILNDYSIKSISFDNSDEQTKEKIKIAFEIIKRNK